VNTAPDACTLYESRITGERITVDLPLEELTGIDEIGADLGLESWVDLEDLPVRKAAGAMWGARRAGAIGARLDAPGEIGDAPLFAKVFGGSAFRLTCPSSNHGPLRRDLNDVDYVMRAGDGPRFIALATRLHQALGSLHMHFAVLDDHRFNSLSAGKRYRLRMVTLSPEGEVCAGMVDVFTEELSFCHRVRLKEVIDSPELTPGLPLLVLTKCQFIKEVRDDLVGAEDRYRVLTDIKGGSVAIGMEDKDMVDVGAAFADHELDSDEFPVSALTEQTARDWGLARTVVLNLRNVAGARHVLAGRGVDPTVAESILRRMAELADRVESQMPRPPRLRVRRTWWEEVEDR
jgi:hypothetical protein